MEQSWTIGCVGRNRRNMELVKQSLEQEGYRICVACSLDEFDNLLENATELNLVLLEVSGFDRSVWERCSSLQKKGVPFVVISPQQTAKQVKEDGGAIGPWTLLTKPLSKKRLLTLVKDLCGE